MRNILGLKNGQHGIRLGPLIAGSVALVVLCSGLLVLIGGLWNHMSITRHFNSREKHIIEKLSRIEMGELKTIGAFLEEDIFSIENDTALIFLPEKEMAILYVRSHFTDSEFRYKIGEFLELMSLIEYLRNERYIHSFQFAATSSVYVMCKDFDKVSLNNAQSLILSSSGHHVKFSDGGNIYNNKDEIVFKGFAFHKKDSSIYSILEKSLASPLFPTEETKEYVKNGFKDSVQIKHEQTLFYSALAIGVALFFSIASLLINIVGIKRSASGEFAKHKGKQPPEHADDPEHKLIKREPQGNSNQ